MNNPLEESHEERMRRPDPDPTEATTALVNGAIASFKEFVTTKFDALERAQALFREDIVRVPTALDKALSQARDYNDAQVAAIVQQAKADFKLNEDRLHALAQTVEVFKTTVNERFQLSDIQTEKAARDVKSAVDAAFAAAKEAVGEQNKSNALSITKSESAFTKQIDQLAESVKSIVKNTDDKINDLKERVLASDSKASVTDPAVQASLNRMTEAISHLATSDNMTKGRSEGAGSILGWIFGGIATLYALVATALLVLNFAHGAAH